MCGIAGAVGGNASDREQDVRAMLGQLIHRGPDDEGLVSARSGTIGVRRLSIIDVLHGHQPMSNEDETIFAVQNGEIYNYLELREELSRRGHTFTTTSDTEVLPHAYEEFGDMFVERLRGMFAIAVWDAGAQKLLLARDRLGKKPLVYAMGPEGISFASEIQALLSTNIERSPDRDAISEYLGLGYIPAPRTAFTAIRKVQPGMSVIFMQGNITETPYWRLAFEPKLAITDEEAVDQLRSKIDDAVRVRLMSEVPLGAFLSGGLDSSTIVAFMAAALPQPVRTFSIGFSETGFNELPYARLVARAFGTRHEEYVVEPSAAEVLPMLVRHLGEPFADSSIVPTYYVAKVARQQVTVALNGDGGDEVFAGYERYRVARAMFAMDTLPSPIRSAIGHVADRLPVLRAPRPLRLATRFASLLKYPADRRYRELVSYFPQAAIEGRDSAAASSSTADVFEAALREGRPANDVDRLLAIDMRTYLPGDLLVKMDIATMANSLEARSPFLDQRLVDFVNRLPARMKSRGTSSKYLLRRLMRGTLPKEILERRKRGFALPVAEWIRGPLRPLLEDCLLAGDDRGFLDRSEIDRLVEEHMDRRADHSHRLWALLMLELWFRHVVESKLPVH